MRTYKPITLFKNKQQPYFYSLERSPKVTWPINTYFDSELFFPES
jgi:hypothetical protein